MKFTAMDVETANSNPASICSMGWVVVENGEIVNEVHQLVRPEPLVFHPRHVRLHGINARHVKGAPTFAQAWRSLCADISGPLFAHNAAFDMSALRGALDQYGLPYPQVDYLCTLVISRSLSPARRRHTLKDLAEEYGIAFSHHDALEDARTCALIALSAARQIGAQSVEQLATLCGLRVGRLFDHGYSTCGLIPGLLRAPALTYELGLQGGEASKQGHAGNTGRGSIAPGTMFAFTGNLIHISREDAIRAVTDAGGSCLDRVTHAIKYVVKGAGGYPDFGSSHQSTKVKAAEKAIAKGVPIQIISERDFLRLLGI